MKRLRLKCPFCGYGTRVAWITLFISSIAGAFFGLLYTDRSDSIETPYVASFLSMAITALLTLTASFLWLNRTTDEEKARIQNADAPVWCKPNREEKQLASATMVVLHFVFILTYVFVGIGAFVLISDLEITPLLVTVLIIVFLIITAVYVWHIMRYRIWREMDDTAICTILPVSSVYVVKSSSRSSWTITNYAVIHTNEGKFILSAKTERMSRSEAKKYRPAKIEKICIVKYKGMITYFPIMQQKAVVIPKSHWDAM